MSNNLIDNGLNTFYRMPVVDAIQRGVEGSSARQ